MTTVFNTWFNAIFQCMGTFWAACVSNGLLQLFLSLSILYIVYRIYRILS